jgi:hypothetical protein
MGDPACALWKKFCSAVQISVQRKTGRFGADLKG